MKIPIVLGLLFSSPFTCLAFAHCEPLKLLGSDANDGDRFGVSVAIDVNIAVIGAYQNDSNGPDCGAAYVYELSGDQWVQRQKLTPSDGCPGDQFGRSVAVEGNTVVIGSYLDNNGTDPNTGSAYVFTRSGDVWTQQQKLTASDANTGDKFGVSVSIGNDTIVVGAYGKNSYTGAAYVFTQTGSIWDFQQKLTTSDACQNDYFGYSVATDTNTIIVGAYNHDHSGNQYVGSAYVYEWQDTEWIERHILHASDSNQADHFGCSVALDGNLAVIGAYECDINNACNAGAAYVFVKTGTNWIERQKLFDAKDPCNKADFGRSVTLEGNTMLAGCPYCVVDGNRTGAVFEFVRSGETWVQRSLLSAPDANKDDEFGFSVALSVGRFVVGSSYDDDAGTNSGSAYIFSDTVTADFDGDSDVDFFDFAILADSWMQDSPLVDIAPPPTGDGIVNTKDLAVLCDNWLSGK